MRLGNLTPARLVKIATFDVGSETMIGEPLVFTVDRVGGSAK